MPQYGESIQSILHLFYCNKKTRAFELRCTVSQDGAVGPIFDENMPP
jgi:hypothetical protein